MEVQILLKMRLLGMTLENIIGIVDATTLQALDVRGDARTADPDSVAVLDSTFNVFQAIANSDHHDTPASINCENGEGVNAEHGGDGASSPSASSAYVEAKTVKKNQISSIHNSTPSAGKSGESTELANKFSGDSSAPSQKSSEPPTRGMGTPSTRSTNQNDADKAGDRM